jgi:hypothetical protein
MPRPKKTPTVSEAVDAALADEKFSRILAALPDRPLSRDELRQLEIGAPPER